MYRALVKRINAMFTAKDRIYIDTESLWDKELRQQPWFHDYSIPNPYFPYDGFLLGLGVFFVVIFVLFLI